MRALWLGAVVVTAASCASAPIRKSDLLALDRADRLVLQGCYDCLLEARDTYAGVATGRARPLVIVRLFETHLLLALRENELAMDAAGALARARALLPELPSGIDGRRYLSIAEVLPGDDFGWSERETDEFRRTHRTAVAKRIDDDLRWLETDPALSQPVRQYLALSFDCLYFTRARSGDVPQPTKSLRDQPPGTPPLLVFRASMCREINLILLERARAEVPRFVETSYFLARLQDNNRQTRERITEVYARFPNSPSVTHLAGRFNQAIGDCEAALRHYEETIALRAGHERAWLGRTVCLTYLKRADEAIASATVMIDKQIEPADAYYWRAFNRRLQKDLAAARSDIERAKAIYRSGDILTLAGMIEHDQDDLDPAERDLTDARRGLTGRDNCVAMWYLGLVHMKRERWGAAAPQFEDAMHCYERRVIGHQRNLAAIANEVDVDPTFKAHQIAGFEAAIKEDRGQHYAGAYNAANNYAGARNFARALELLDIAAKDPDLDAQVKKLRELIKER
jgi:tetratricopeptide (TPR) repeat protein